MAITSQVCLSTLPSLGGGQPCVLMSPNVVSSGPKNSRQKGRQEKAESFPTIPEMRANLHQVEISGVMRTKVLRGSTTQRAQHGLRSQTNPV